MYYVCMYVCSTFIVAIHYTCYVRCLIQEVNNLVNKAYQRTKQLLGDHNNKLEKVAKTLLEKEVINYKDLVELIGPMAFIVNCQTIAVITVQYSS